jgi:hypothetical protein
MMAPRLRTRESFPWVGVCGLLLLLACAACSDEERGAPPPGSDASTPECSEGVVLASGECFAPGIPAGDCASGFEAAGSGCRAVLPAQPCAPGSMAVPGDTSCREVLPCGDPPYGDVPIEADSEFVDASYAGGDSDGTFERPWTTIQAGVDASLPGAIVAVAAGSYLEDVEITEHPVRLRGRCPALSEVRGVGGFSVIEVLGGGASGTVIGGLAVRSDAVQYGIGVSSAEDVVVDAVWVHDTGLPGVQSDVATGAASLTVRGSLVERAGGVGVWTRGASVTVESTEVRDSVEDTIGGLGRGIVGVDNPDKRAKATVHVRNCLVRNTREVAIAVTGSDLDIEATAIHDTLPAGNGAYGIGVLAQTTLDGVRSSLTLSSTVIERSHNSGVILMGSDASIETTTVRDVLAGMDGRGGRGINVQFAAETMTPSTASIRATLVERTSEVGLIVIESAATIDATWVRDTAPQSSDGLFGDAMVLLAPFTETSAHVTRSRFERSARAGTFSAGAALSIGESTFECNPIQLNGQDYSGRAFTFQDLGGNSCGCQGVVASCAVVSSSLDPPLPLDPL